MLTKKYYELAAREIGVFMGHALKSDLYKVLQTPESREAHIKSELLKVMSIFLEFEKLKPNPNFDRYRFNDRVLEVVNELYIKVDDIGKGNPIFDGLNYLDKHIDENLKSL